MIRLLFMTSSAQAEKPSCQADLNGNVLTFYLSGDWLIRNNLPKFETVLARTDCELKGDGSDQIAFNLDSLGNWDSGLLTFLLYGFEFTRSTKALFMWETLPSDIGKLLQLATAVPEKKGTGKNGEKTNFFERIGLGSVKTAGGFSEAVIFCGDCVYSFFSMVFGRARLRWRDFFLVLQECSVNALPIITLISFLIGLIIAFLGAVVLLKFGAEIYVSYLVGYGMLREMGAVMAGIIMAGRTGAAFAAQIGSMKVTEEIDALKTLGISPIDFIVLPRILAMFLMMPLLAIYGDFIGIAGGMLVSVTMLDISPEQFWQGLLEVIEISDFLLGVIKGTVFGVIVAISGCLRGMQCGNSADAVGLSTTSAVVTGITWIIITNAIIDWIAAIYGI